MRHVTEFLFFECLPRRCKHAGPSVVSTDLGGRRRAASSFKSLSIQESDVMLELLILLIILFESFGATNFLCQLASHYRSFGSRSQVCIWIEIGRPQLQMQSFFLIALAFSRSSNFLLLSTNLVFSFGKLWCWDETVSSF
jgi:hypothetical protein